MSADIADTAIVYPGTVVGDGCQILDYAVVGKQPKLSPRSTAQQEELRPLELGPGTIVSSPPPALTSSTPAGTTITSSQGVP